ncbi:MAG: hypothetical protein GWN58_65580, partial [Anaerolineae bacterium]|nr:hypothetical protein [Anaerolineae bacterium]
LGTGLFLVRHRVRAWQTRIGEQWSVNTLYAWLLGLIDRAAGLATRLQGGNLRTYLIVILLGMVALVVGLGG